MGMLEELAEQAGGLDFGAIGEKLGLSADQVQAAASQLLPHIADPNTDNDQATQAVAAQTGIDFSQLSALLPALLAAAGSKGGDAGGLLGNLMSSLGGGAPAGNGGDGGGLLGALGGLLNSKS
ncbi:hypothetical protein [Rhizorhabdus wittichii]|uniref:hypothetical protein n=1 Tax=Rhizorhabdus wittichii TaxID=160791 RepID=UPI0002ED4026|nr:hypothetical protein [Rhizorhabdus wittichii]